MPSHHYFGKPSQEAYRIDNRKITFQGIVEADIVDLLTHFMPKKSRLARLPWPRDQGNGRFTPILHNQFL